MKQISTRTVRIGEVGVDSGQLMICDPSYIPSQWQEREMTSTHPVYRDVKDSSLWQFTFGGPAGNPDITPFPGTYDKVIDKYGKCPNDLISSGVFKEDDSVKPMVEMKEGEFSYPSICMTTGSSNKGGQLNYALGHAGVAVAFSSGFGDGTYGVFAELVTYEMYGERVKKVWVELITGTDENNMEMLVAGATNKN